MRGSAKPGCSGRSVARGVGAGPCRRGRGDRHAGRCLGAVPRGRLGRCPGRARRGTGPRGGTDLGRAVGGRRTRPPRRSALPLGYPLPDGGTARRQQTRVHVASVSAERSGWAALEVVDCRREDPRTGLYSASLVAVLRSDYRVVCVLNRKGRAQLSACDACGELATCEQCGAAVAVVGEGMVCRRCGTSRPLVCASCGSSVLRLLRVGVSRAREQLEALAGRPVGEVSAGYGPSPYDAGARWHRGCAVPGGRAAQGRGSGGGGVPGLRPGVAGSPLPGRRGGPGPARTGLAPGRRPPTSGQGARADQSARATR